MPILTTETMFEHSETKNFDVSPQEAASLVRLKKMLGVEVEVLHPTYDRELQSFQYVGVVNLGRRAVQILPKIYSVTDGQSEEDHIDSATKNLLSLLSYAGELRIYEQDVSPLIKRRLNWLEILITLFANNLFKEWNSGASKYYKSVEDDLPLIRGRLRINEQIRKPARNHIFSVTYDEFSVDNNLNRILRYVVEKLYYISQDEENKRQFRLIRRLMSEVSLLPIVTYADAQLVHITRLNKRYEPLLNLAKLFLGSDSIQLASGNYNSFAFVFDMDRLFEAFIINFIIRHKEQILPNHLQHCDLIPQGKGISIVLSTRNGKPFRSVSKPDLVFQENGNFPLLLDTKYKILKSSKNQSMSRADFNQIFVYSKLYKCQKAILIYPHTSSEDSVIIDKEREEMEGAEYMITTVDLRVEIDTNEGKMKLIENLRRILE